MYRIEWNNQAVKHVIRNVQIDLHTGINNGLKRPHISGTQQRNFNPYPANVENMVSS